MKKITLADLLSTVTAPAPMFNGGALIPTPGMTSINGTTTTYFVCNKAWQQWHQGHVKAQQRLQALVAQYRHPSNEPAINSIVKAKGGWMFTYFMDIDKSAKQQFKQELMAYGKENYRILNCNRFPGNKDKLEFNVMVTDEMMAMQLKLTYC